ncbi:AAA family ATPase [Gloeothece verrucosa]|uniref:ATPase-like protein n=1 Tax=Gloeothece verrucosa (strain PCC 7822) TaxID=497965 RepID=E0UEA6_GLOV7|nr:AAA family ATPase [Gloeothece verrucosa]ADN14231.1 ATPase-like protein [Gloeothece verrucosa PCC 7822]
MLKRIYIDNFRCFVNFELSLRQINLFMGLNGTGKSTVFEVLRKLQAFITGEGQIHQIFKLADFTIWQKLPLQTFELEIEGNEGNYKYELAIEHNQEINKARIHYKRLFFDGNRLIKFESGEVKIYRDNYSEEGTIPFNAALSSLPSMSDTVNTKKLSWFKKRLERFLIIKILPTLIKDESEKEENLLLYNMKNFASWYRYMSQNQRKSFEVQKSLKDIFDESVYLKFDIFGESKRILKMVFEGKAGNIEYRLNQLSDGQKCLVVLYSLISCTQSEDYTLCLDEPDNFLALPEIQPWFMQLYDLCGEGKLQALLISHHPELINILATSLGCWFERENNYTPVRVKAVRDFNKNTGLTVSELVARGWLDD